MIIPNGTIEAKIKQAGGLNPETKHPVKPSYSWGEPIECQILTNSYNALALNNNEHVTSASYSVLLDGMEYDAKQVRLTDRNGKVLGEFSIRQTEYLDAVNQIKLTL